MSGDVTIHVHAGSGTEVKTTQVAEEDGCPHQHEGDPTVRPCAHEANEASVGHLFRYQDRVYTISIDCDPRRRQSPGGMSQYCSVTINGDGMGTLGHGFAFFRSPKEALAAAQHFIKTGEVKDAHTLPFQDDRGRTPDPTKGKPFEPYRVEPVWLTAPRGIAEEPAPVVYEAASRTYAQAQAEILAHLRARGWTVRSDLKIPHATSPDGELRLYFKPQAVYYTQGNRHEFKNARSTWVSDIRKLTPAQFDAEIQRMFSGRHGAASPLASAAGAAVGTMVAGVLAAEEGAGECLPWVKIERDPARYDECLKMGQKIGPIDTPRKVYDLLHGEFDRRDQETLVVVGLNVRGELRTKPIEVAYGQRSKVAVGINDIMRAALVSGAEMICIAHAHPSGNATPSKADRDLTKAVEKACETCEIIFADHVVIGARSFHSIKEGKTYKI